MRAYDFNDLRYVFGSSWNDGISSVKVVGGAWVRLCDQHSWLSGCIDTRASIADLRPYYLNDKISSVGFQATNAGDFTP